MACALGFGTMVWTGCDQAFYLVETSGVWKPDRSEVEEALKEDLLGGGQAGKLGIRLYELRVQQLGDPSRNPWTREVEAPVQFFLYVEWKNGRRFQQNYDALVVREGTKGWHLKKMFIYSIRTQLQSVGT